MRSLKAAPARDKWEGVHVSTFGVYITTANIHAFEARRAKLRYLLDKGHLHHTAQAAVRTAHVLYRPSLAYFDM